MSLLVVKAALNKFWIWIKEHWQIPFLVFWTILVYIFARRNTDAVIEVYEARKKSYQNQIEALEKRHALELLERNNLIEEYHSTVKKVEREFEKKKSKLSLKQKNTIKEIVLNSKGDPSEVRKEIENLFNFVYTD